MDLDGIYFYNGFWFLLFSGGLGMGMSWWWDSYIVFNDLYYYFGLIVNLVVEILFLEWNM